MTVKEAILPDLKALTCEEATKLFAGWNEKPYRTKQVRNWVFSRGFSDFEEMSDLSKALRAKLGSGSKITSLEIVEEREAPDGTAKFLFRLVDGLTVETVLIPDSNRSTLCVSTQAGCSMGCGFCLTAKGGLARNLTAGEIVDQVVRIKTGTPPRNITNIVFMGMGEPLNNYENVLQAIKVITDPDISLVGIRKITLSTAGLVPGILRLAKDLPSVKLAVSLNASDDDLRDRIMPINRKYSIATLMSALKKWPLPQGKLLTIEYVLLAGVNDSDDDARRLHNITRNLPSKINLIPFNPCSDLPYAPPPEYRIKGFMKILKGFNRVVIIRKSRGAGIQAECGQLSHSNRVYSNC